jgi:hypothetical protein
MSEKSLEEKVEDYVLDTTKESQYEIYGVDPAIKEAFKAGYLLAQKENDKLRNFLKELKIKFEEKFPNTPNQIAMVALSESFDLVTKNEDLQQKLDTYIQLAETKGKELEEAKKVFRDIVEIIDGKDSDGRDLPEILELCQAYLEKWK